MNYFRSIKNFTKFLVGIRQMNSTVYVCVFSAFLLPCHVVWLDGGRLVGLFGVRLGVSESLFGLQCGLFPLLRGMGSVVVNLSG